MQLMKREKLSPAYQQIAQYQLFRCPSCVRGIGPFLQLLLLECAAGRDSLANAELQNVVRDRNFLSQSSDLRFRALSRPCRILAFDTGFSRGADLIVINRGNGNLNVLVFGDVGNTVVSVKHIAGEAYNRDGRHSDSDVKERT